MNTAWFRSRFVVSIVLLHNFYFVIARRNDEAIFFLQYQSREKQIKGGSRAKKIELINKMNAGWRDLYDDL